MKQKIRKQKMKSDKLSKKKELDFAINLHRWHLLMLDGGWEAALLKISLTSAFCVKPWGCFFHVWIFVLMTETFRRIRQNRISLKWTNWLSVVFNKSKYMRCYLAVMLRESRQLFWCTKLSVAKKAVTSLSSCPKPQVQMKAFIENHRYPEVH